MELESEHSESTELACPHCPQDRAGCDCSEKLKFSNSEGPASVRAEFMVTEDVDEVGAPKKYLDNSVDEPSDAEAPTPPAPELNTEVNHQVEGEDSDGIVLVESRTAKAMIS